MNSLIESLNMWGARFVDFALPVLWQSSLLMLAIFGIDFFLRRKIRPAVRYTLWFVVFIKLLIPPTLALPTSAAWWLRTRKVVVVAPPQPTMIVSYREPVASYVMPQTPVVHYTPPPPRLSAEAGILVGSLCMSFFLCAWAVFRWRQVMRCVRGTVPARGEIQDLFTEILNRAGVRKSVRLQLTADSMSPAVCGLFRPVVLLPQSLVERLDRNQLRAVLLHELIHLRRHDVWVNCAQTLLQIVYWWHPLLWFANARMRRVREEAVDDAVMFALNEEADIYAPTLLEVAKLEFNRPLATLGLVGILESRNALRHRIERLLNFSAPRRVGVSVMSVLGIAAFTALAVPMGEPPAHIVGIANEEQLRRGSALINLETSPGDVTSQNTLGELGLANLAAKDNSSSATPGFSKSSGADAPDLFGPQIQSGAGGVALTGQLPLPRGRVRQLAQNSIPLGDHAVPLDGTVATNSQRKNVMIEAQFYKMKPADFAKLNLDSALGHRAQDLAPWWNLSAEQLTNIQSRIKELGVETLSRPTIAALDGEPAQLFIGDDTNNIQLECVPYVLDDVIKLHSLVRTSGKYAAGGQGSKTTGHTDYAIFSRADITNGSGIVLQAEHAGATREEELIVLLKAKILSEPIRSKDKVPFLGDLPGVGRLFRSDVSNAPYLGPTSPTSTPAPDNRVDMVDPFLSDGKSLYEQGKLSGAQKKFENALVLQPDNQAARYYLSLIKQQMQGKVDAQLPKLRDSNARTNIINTNAARQKLYDKLNIITFDKISFSGLPLSEVIRNLSEQTKRRDIDQQGINFLLNRAKPSAAETPLNGQPQAFNPATGQPMAAPPATPSDDIDLAAVTISLDPALQNVRLLDVLEAIVKSANHPIKYSLLDYGIEFSIKGPEQLMLHTRTFKLDPNTFYMGLQNVGVLKLGNSSGSNYVASAPQANATASTNRGLRYVGGVDTQAEIQLAVINFFYAIGVTLAAPKSVFFNDRQGTLTVHATDADLDVIEQAINTLNIAPPEVTVKVRFVEVDTEFLDTLFMNGVGVSTNTVWTGILAESKFRPILKSVQKKEHATLLNEGEITTLSGRQGQLQIFDVMTILNGVNATETNKAMTYSYGMTNMHFGTVLDVIPTVSADGYTISMKVEPTVTEFLGYEDPKDYLKYDKNLKNVRLPLPKTRVRQVTTSVNVWDGQTLVLGNFGDQSVVTAPNGAKVFQQPYVDKKKKKKLIVFITPTIIDPSGNRIHSKDYYDGPTY